MSENKAFFQEKLSKTLSISFENAKEAIEFYKAEADQWKKLDRIPKDFTPKYSNALSTQLDKIEKLVSAAQALEKQPQVDSPAYQEFRALVLTHREDIRGIRTLCSRLPIDAAILDLSEIDPQAAAVGLMARQQQYSPTHGANESQHGSINIALSRFAIATTSNGGKEALLEGYSQQVENKITGWRNNVNTIVDEAKETSANHNKAIAELQSLHQQNSNEHKDLISTQKDELKKLKDKYEIYMSLKTPVKYWRNRGLLAFGAATGYLIIFIAVIFAIYAFTLSSVEAFVLPNLPKDANNSIILKDLDLTKTLLPLVPIILLLAVPLMWVLRHISRMFVENISDYRDAMLRSTMAQTYLALVSLPEAKIGDNERAIVLQALFRPGSSQPTDEGVPHPLVDLLAGIKAKG